MTVLFVLLLILSLGVNIFLAYLLHGFIKRLMGAENVINEVNDVIDSLLIFCEDLKRKSLVYYSPEAQHFHKLVIKLSKPLENITRKEETGG